MLDNCRVPFSKFIESLTLRNPDELKNWVAEFVSREFSSSGVSVRERSGQQPFGFELIAGDASPRKYYRVGLPTVGDSDARSLVAVDAPSTEKTPEFLHVRELLESAGVRVPRLMSADGEAGFLLLEDLGDDVLLPILSAHSVEAWYADALDALAKVAGIPTAGAGLPDYDGPRLQAEMDLFRDWFVPKLLGLPWSSGLEAGFHDLSDYLVASATEQPQVVTHRDFHSRNLMVVEDGGLAVIDFQDAVIGPVTYDPVSLLKDCYIQWPRQQQLVWLLAHKRNLTGRLPLGTVGDDTFVRWFDLMGLQRHIKVLGIFARLCLRDGKPAYLNDLPLVIHYISQVLDLYAPTIGAIARFRELLNTQVLPACRTQPWYQQESTP